MLSIRQMVLKGAPASSIMTTTTTTRRPLLGMFLRSSTTRSNHTRQQQQQQPNHHLHFSTLAAPIIDNEGNDKIFDATTSTHQHSITTANPTALLITSLWSLSSSLSRWNTAHDGRSSLSNIFSSLLHHENNDDDDDDGLFLISTLKRRRKKIKKHKLKKRRKKDKMKTNK